MSLRIKSPRFLLLIAICLAALFTIAQPQTAIHLDHVDGSYLPGTISSQGTITFHIRYENRNSFQGELRGATNGFKLYSPNGARWSPPVAEEAIPLADYFDLLHTIGYLSPTGSFADTVYLNLIRLAAPGFEPGFDETILKISTSVASGYVGRTLCIDSASYLMPSGFWLWSFGAEHGSLMPEWGGPYCFTIDTSGCCQMVGDVNHDGSPVITIDDLVYLASYMFQDGPPPICPAEANIDGDQENLIIITDLIYLVTFMFNDGPPPVPCR